MKAVVVRPAAAREVDDAAAYYAAQNPPLGEALYDEVDRALALLAERPGLGSTRYQHVRSDRPRMWPIGRFPYLVFYLEHHDRIEIIRFLHAHRDLPIALRDQHR